ncbi:BED-type domain-containing protein [Citrus sinensis]|uniref:BED-type domain-containing protein n=1 Tax=Citrus sinensis TaxID=2711 RepID=A0ACB8N4V6_CITSI|nr:BED-type domain-containing protein [Citrus sinensis]
MVDNVGEVQIIDEVQQVSSEEGVSGSNKRKIELRSFVWKHFSKLPGGLRAKCHYCRRSYAAHSNSGTSGLSTHLDRCKVRKKMKAENDAKQQTLVFKKGKGKDDGTAKVTHIGFNREACRMALVKMIIKDELPFRFVEAEGFLEFMETCCPKFEVPSRRTITRDILELYQNEKGLLKSILSANKQRVCITTDTWTSIQMSNFMVVTAHFIDEEWVLHKRILTFTPISNHKGDGIGKLIENCLIDWGIEKLFTITVDNASANTLAIAYVKKKLANWSGNSMVLNGLYMHVRCSAHIINLIVQDGLSQVSHSIASIRNAVKYVRSSPARLQKFKTCVDREKISRGGLMVLDVPTRWNSTYLMLEKAVAFEKAFERLKEDDGHYTNWFDEDESEKRRVGPPIDKDWENAKRLVKCLSIFYHVTLKFSSSLTVTSNNFLNEMWKVYIHLKSLVDSNDFLLNQMGYKMEEKFVKYWGHFFEKVNMLLIVANVLDPRCKLDFVIWCFSSLYDIRKVDELRANIKELLLKLLENYGGESNRNRGERCRAVHDGASSSVESFDPFTQFKKMKESSNDDISGKNDVEKYLSETCESASNPQFDILTWWKLNGPRYPILSQIAKDVLAIPVSTVASESAFSTGGRILDPFRSSLTHKTVESLICTQNWLRSTLLGECTIQPSQEEAEFYELVETDPNIELENA